MAHEAHLSEVGREEDTVVMKEKKGKWCELRAQGKTKKAVFIEYVLRQRLSKPEGSLAMSR